MLLWNASLETACVRVPGDLPQLQRSVLLALLGLAAPRIAFSVGATGEVSIEERQQQLEAHRALLMAVEQEPRERKRPRRAGLQELLNGDLSAADRTALAWSCVLRANAGLALSEHLQNLAAELREQVEAQLCRAELMQWMRPEAKRLLWSAGWSACGATVPPVSSLPRRAGAVGASSALRAKLVDGVPEEFRCALDGRLMVDPVRAPDGRHYERSTLRLALQQGAQFWHLLNSLARGAQGGARVFQALEELRRKQDEHFAVELDSGLYRLGISACGSSRLWQHACWLLKVMPRAQVRRDVATFSAAMTACGKGPGALSLYDAMPCRRLQASLISFNASMSSCEKASRWPEALSFVSQRCNDRLHPDLISLNAAISSASGYQWLGALHLLQGSQMSALRVDIISFTAAMWSCELSNQWRWALSTFDPWKDVEVDGGRRGRPADAHGFSAAISAAKKTTTAWPLAFELFEQMAEDRLQVDIISSGMALALETRRDRQQKALQAFHVMDQESLRPNLVSFNAVISACGSQWHWSLRLLQLMSELRVLPDLLSFALVAEALGSRVPGTEALSSILDAMSSCTVDQLFLAMASLAPSVCRGLRRGLVPPAVSAVQRRFLNLHEYQAQIIFQKFGVGVPKNLPAFSPEEAVEKANEMPGDEVVVKAQVLAGGRGLGHFKEKLSQGAVLWCAGAKEEENNFQGGVHIVKKEKVKEVAEKMLGKTLITKQTGAEGKPNNTCLGPTWVDGSMARWFER
eukprot:g3552.t1